MRKQENQLNLRPIIFPADYDEATYKFVKRYDKVVRKGNAAPAIKDFSLQTLFGNDTTKALLNEDEYQLYPVLERTVIHQRRMAQGTEYDHAERRAKNI